MLFRIDPSNGSPVYEQIARQVTFAVACGSLKSGEMIPSVRQLAKDLAVNPNTIARAYRDLQDDGIITPLRGTGLQISQGALRKCTTARRDHIKGRFRSIIDEARQSQLEDAEIHTVFESELAKRSKMSRNNTVDVSHAGEKQGEKQ